MTKWTFCFLLNLIHLFWSCRLIVCQPYCPFWFFRSFHLFKFFYFWRITVCTITIFSIYIFYFLIIKLLFSNLIIWIFVLKIYFCIIISISCRLAWLVVEWECLIRFFECFLIKFLNLFNFFWRLRPQNLLISALIKCLCHTLILNS